LYHLCKLSNTLQGRQLSISEVYQNLEGATLALDSLKELPEPTAGS
jgi:hypothetical protein